MSSLTRSESASIEIKDAPGVYVPSADSRILSEVFAERGPSPEAFVLDACCGSGIQGIAAARAGHRVIAVDSKSEAVKATRLNALLNDVEIEAFQGDLFAPVDGWRFDAVLANPPYLPTQPGSDHASWCDGGANGRAVIDRICTHASRVLGERGRLWMVQSSLADIPLSLQMLESAGFDAQIVASEEVQLGPVSLARQQYLVDSGYLDKSADVEQLVVIEARQEM
jgi:release factor glutamine methyltransferase